MHCPPSFEIVLPDRSSPAGRIGRVKPGFQGEKQNSYLGRVWLGKRRCFWKIRRMTDPDIPRRGCPKVFGSLEPPKPWPLDPLEVAVEALSEHAPAPLESTLPSASRATRPTVKGQHTDCPRQRHLQPAVQVSWGKREFLLGPSVRMEVQQAWDANSYSCPPKLWVGRLGSGPPRHPQRLRPPFNSKGPCSLGATESRNRLSDALAQINSHHRDRQPLRGPR